MKIPDFSMRTIASALLVAAMILPSGLANAGVSSGDYIGKRPSEIVENLERQGYVVGELETERGYFEVEASIDGKGYEIHIDPESGKVAKIDKDD